LRLLQSPDSACLAGLEIDSVDRSIAKLRYKQALMRNVNRKMINASYDIGQRDRPLKLQLDRRLILRRVAKSRARQERQRRYEQCKSRACWRQAIVASHPDPLSYFTITQVG
jgi:hypothetical protein